jgi:hypothetical protein
LQAGPLSQAASQALDQPGIDRQAIEEPRLGAVGALTEQALRRDMR